MTSKVRGFFLLTLFLVLVMYQADPDDDELSGEGEEDEEDSYSEGVLEVPETQRLQPDAFEARDDAESRDDPEPDNTQAVRRRSVRLAKKVTPSIKKWPIGKILVELFKAGVAPPRGGVPQRALRVLLPATGGRVQLSRSRGPPRSPNSGAIRLRPSNESQS